MAQGLRGIQAQRGMVGELPALFSNEENPLESLDRTGPVEIKFKDRFKPDIARRIIL